MISTINSDNAQYLFKSNEWLECQISSTLKSIDDSIDDYKNLLAAIEVKKALQDQNLVPIKSADGIEIVKLTDIVRYPDHPQIPTVINDKYDVITASNNNPTN